MSPNVLGVLLLVALTVTVPSVLSSSEGCTTTSECPPNFCCLLQPMRYAIPTCVPVQQKGEICRPNASTITTNLTYPDNSRLEVKDINYILCSCIDGSSCNPRKGVCT
ncbi:astakine-like [Pseudomyrmex gracilis]|uniref:astakine-like n=1 Tax=Pseudomyrmex gracilis TaxID=219809 RepID=UPI00099511FC|nr:astakine-like [Pseudomyrmex gracilis]XP_020293994.1 astakine-like [Pseudomyrmex gracilis]